MKLEYREKLTETFFKECQELIVKKGKDYEPTGIAFATLIKEAEDLGMTPEQLLCVHMSKQWSAIKKYAKTGKLESEPIRERCKDLANYCALFAALVESDNGTL